MGLAGGVLFLAVLLAYLPANRAGYVWDDDKLLTNNPSVVGTRGLAAVWTTRAADICPLTITALWAAHRVWGANPWPYHLANVLLHAVNALLLWRALARLRVPGAWWGAAFWALHPVQAETVAWISESKNTLSGVFYLLAILFFLRRLDAGAGWNTALAVLCAALAMAAKTSAMVLPAVLCLLAWWVEGRRGWRRLPEIAPFLLLSLAVGALSVWTQAAARGGADAGRAWTLSGPQRLAAAGDAVWFYLGKLLWPHPLLAVYPRWEIDTGRPTAFLPLLALAAVGLALWLGRAAVWDRAGLLALAYFVAVLLPVLGAVNISYYRHSFVADHFLYLASMGPLALAGTGIARLARHRAAAKTPWLPTTCGAALLGLLGTLSWQRAGVFRSEQTLWTDTLAKNPCCWVGHNGLGLVFQHEGRPDDAVREHRLALQADPASAESRNNLGNALLQEGQTEEAIRQYREALQIQPGHASTHNNLGNALASLGRGDEAIGEYEQALRTAPDDASAHLNLGNVLLQKGQADAAIHQYQNALQAEPRNGLAHHLLGDTFLRAGRVAEAASEYRRTVQLDPGQASAHSNLGVCLFQQGDADAAMAEFQKALAIEPRDARTRYDLGIALVNRGRLDEAIQQYQEAVRINPVDADIHLNLGNAFLQKGQVDAAVPQYREALRTRPGFLTAHRNLGAALARGGQTDEAVGEYREVLRLRPADAQAHRDLGNALAQAGRLDAAAAEMREALRLKPDYREAQDGLAAVLALMQPASD